MVFGVNLETVTLGLGPELDPFILVFAAVGVLLAVNALFFGSRYVRFLTTDDADRRDLPGRGRDDMREGAGEDLDAVARLARARNSEVFVFAHGYDEGTPSYAKSDVIGREEVKYFLHRLHRIQKENPLARIDLVLHADSAHPSFAIQITRAIKRHRGETTVFVPYYAKGFASLLAFGGSQVVLGNSAFLTFGQIRLGWLLRAVAKKWLRNCEDEEVFDFHNVSRLTREIADMICQLLHGGRHGHACRIGRKLAFGDYADSKVIDAIVARQLGLNVTTEMPAEVFEIVQEHQTDPPRHLPTHPAVISRASKSGRSASEHDDDFEHEVSTTGVCAATCDIGVRRFVAAMEARRRTRVFCLLHERNMQSVRVDELSSVEILKFLAKVDPDQDIDLILHTGGGLGTAGYQIAQALKSHRGRVTVFVPYFAYSAGTIISLAADEIVMSPDAVLGPIDAQLGGVPAAAFLSLLRYKPASRIRADNLAIALEYRANSEADHSNSVALMLPRYQRSTADRIVRRLNDGALTHGYPVSCSEASQLGLRVRCDMPDEPMDIIEYFRNHGGKFCSVIHCGEA